MTRLDPHSYGDGDQPRTRRLDLAFDVDFARQALVGRASLDLGGPSRGPLDLDTKGLTVHAARTEDGRAVPFTLDAEEPILGRRLRLELPAGTRRLEIAYETAPDAVGLQWLAPEQTEGKRHPFLFSQCQAIHARTMMPCQDTPVVRTPYHAEVTIPDGLAAVMSAGPSGQRTGPRPGTRTWAFDMPQAIPSYLLALAVGDLQAKDLSPRARVWAEPETVEAAAWEFAGVEGMIQAAERLFGPYEWDRYDMLVLPPAFPYGGMENPRMTFLTPTLLAGDRSLVDVVAHELAHSWTGNLVSNATMEHFWLNEGFTVWAERRLVEALHGPEATALAWAIGQNALDESVTRFGADSPLTKLRTDLAGVDPDEAFSSIPYEKGARLVALLERTVGRERFDRFVQAYIARFRFTSITTEEFLAFLDAELPGAGASVGIRDWLFAVGMPANAPVFRSDALTTLTALAEGFIGGARPSPAQISAWNPTQVLIYLQHLPRELPPADCAWLDANLALTPRGNHEILVEWLTIAAGSDYEPVFARVRQVLSRVGRMKYLRPLYAALGRHPRTRALAREVFAQARPGYHALSRRVIESVLEKYDG
jgi:leukotriene-A4 hydrolase